MFLIVYEYDKVVPFPIPTLSVKATEKVVSNYIQTLRDMSADLTEKQKKSIRNQLREL